MKSEGDRGCLGEDEAGTLRHVRKIAGRGLSTAPRLPQPLEEGLRRAIPQPPQWGSHPLWLSTGKVGLPTRVTERGAGGGKEGIKMKSRREAVCRRMFPKSMRSEKHNTISSESLISKNVVRA